MVINVNSIWCANAKRMKSLVPSIMEHHQQPKQSKDDCELFNIQSDRLRSPEYVNYYDSNIDMLTQLKKELPDEENHETSCSFGSDLFFEDEKILKTKSIITNDSKNNNTDERLILNGIIKPEKEYQVVIKTETLEEHVESDNKYCVTVKAEESDNKRDVSLKTKEHIDQEEPHNMCFVTKNTQRSVDQETLDNVRNTSVHYNVLVKPKRVECKWCGRPFENNFNLLKHNTEHLKLDINIPNHIQNERRKRIKNKIIKINESNELFHCNYCDKAFKLIQHRKVHIRTVHSKKKYYCDLCGKRFKCLQYIRTHMQSIHMPVLRANNLKCQFCDVVVKHKYNLHCHIKTVHNNETFKCDTCDAVFKCKQYLMLHCKRMHYNYGRTFPCEWCDKEFRTPLHLHDHTKRLHIDLVKKLKQACPT